jgi:hypothetical protein
VWERVPLIIDLIENGSGLVVLIDAVGRPGEEGGELENSDEIRQ